MQCVGQMDVFGFFACFRGPVAGSWELHIRGRREDGNVVGDKSAVCHGEVEGLVALH